MGIVIRQPLFFGIIEEVSGNGPVSALHVDIRVVIGHLAVVIKTVPNEHVALDNTPDRSFLHVDVLGRSPADDVAGDFRIVHAPVVAAIAVL